MAGGGNIRIVDADDFGERARVINGALLVTGISGGGGGGDVNVAFVGGNPVGSTLPVSGTVTVTDGGGSLTVDGTVAVSNFPATVAVTQSTSPWVVSGTVAVSSVGGTVTITDGGGSITVDGTVAATQSGAWTVAATQSGAWSVAVSSVGGTVAVTQSTSPWVVSGTVSATQGTSPWVIGDGGGSITVDGTVAVTQSTSPWVVSGTVAVSAVAGTVAVTQSTSPWVIGDGGGSITVDGSVGATLTGTVDAGNSSTTPLAANGTFTGTFVEVTNHAMVTVTVFANVASATDGMKLQWSGNGVDVDREETITIAAGSAGGRALALNVRGRYFRVVYINGGTIQATFRLGTVLHPVGTGLNNVVIDQQIPTTAIAILTRSIITGESTAGGGSFVNVKVAPSGAVAADVTQNTSPWVVSGTVAVSAVGGTVAVTQSTSPWVVSGTVAVGPTVTPGTGAANLGKAQGAAFGFGDTGVLMLAVDSGTLTYTPLLASGNAVFVNVQGVTPGVAANNLGKAEDAVHTSGDVGVMALAVRNDSHTVNAANGDYIPLIVGANGALWVNALQSGQWYISSGNDASGVLLDVYEETSSFPPRTTGTAPMFHCITAGAVLPTDSTWTPGYVSSATGGLLVEVQNSITISSVFPGKGATNLGKAEDDAHTSGDTGVMALAVRQDTLASLAGATGDYIPLTVDSLGRLHVINKSGLTTYRAATTAPFVAAAGAASFFVISGSSTKTIKVQRIVISGFSLTAVAYIAVVCEKWGTTAFTGGTPTALTQVPLDSTYAAGTAALCQVYTAAPTEGTLVGTIATRRQLMQATTAAAAGIPGEMVFDFRVQGENNPAVLRGTAQSIGLAFAAAPASAVTLALEVEWTEE